MKSVCAAVLLLAAPASGVVVKSDAFLSKAMTESDALNTESQSLNHTLQSVADKLEPGATRDFLKTLRLCAPCQKYERIGEPHDGGYVMCTDGLDQGLVGAYSYGINGFDGWGMKVASRYNLPLEEYDCTNFQRPAVCAGCKVNFHGECILEQNGSPKRNYKTLGQQLKESNNGKAADRSLLLKIDVEAAEWQVFAQEPVENLRKFREIVVEYHWISETHNHALYAKAVKQIEAAGFAVTHLHGNNFGGGLQYFGEYKIPNVLEVTYIPAPAQCASNIPYHVPQDMTNNAGSGEIPDAKLPTSM